jgi:hypothetical protein
MKTTLIIAGLLACVLTTAAFTAPPPQSKHDPIRAAAALSLNADYEASEAILSKIKSDEPAYYYWRMVNAHRLNNKAGVIKWADLILDDFDRARYPLRYRELAALCRHDVETWKDATDDLGDVARDMDVIRDRLINGKGGKDTQAKQKAVADRLKKMIDKIEDDQKKAAEAAAAAQMELEKQRQARLRGGQPTPPPDTPKGQESGPGKVDPQRVKEIAEVWGKLPEKERVKVMAELTRGMPARDKAVMERYFHELAKKKHAPKK